MNVPEPRTGRADDDCLEIARLAQADDGAFDLGTFFETGILFAEIRDTLPEAALEFTWEEDPVEVSELVPEGVLVFSCNEPLRDRDRWAVFRDRDGATVLVTNGRTVRRYRGGVSVV